MPPGHEPGGSRVGNPQATRAVWPHDEAVDGAGECFVLSGTSMSKVWTLCRSVPRSRVRCLG
jgi:hypothetical protein